MRHAENDVLHTERATALDDLLKCGDHRLATVETETLGARVTDIDEFLEAVCFNELVENRALAFAREGYFLIRTFNALLDPGFFFRPGDVHELDADGLAVSTLQDRNHLAQARKLEAEHVVDENLAVEVRFRKSIRLRIEFGMRLLRLELQGIEPRIEMTTRAIGADHHQRFN
jgi:hypothetical protein